MAYIYQIKNKINDKIYIGKTLETIEKRWKEHCNDYLKDRTEKRPLYMAMKKYGIENFSIEIIEECLGHLRGMRDTWKEVMKASKMAPASNSQEA